MTLLGNKALLSGVDLQMLNADLYRNTSLWFTFEFCFSASGQQAEFSLGQMNFIGDDSLDVSVYILLPEVGRKVSCLVIS